MGSLLPFVSINVLNENRKTYKKSTTGFTRDGRPVAHSADPIPPHELPRIKEYFLNGKNRYGLRNWTLLLLGINIGMRCGDLTRLRVGQVWDGKEVKTDVEYYAEKTRSWEKFYIRDDLKNDIKKYILSLKNQSSGAFLFPSERADHMKTNTVYQVFKKASNDLGLNFHFSTHSMRQTLGNMANDLHGLEAARLALRHRDYKSTMHYIKSDEVRTKSIMLSLPTIKC